ncbi:PVC-type heme-binding CxxCH protein [Rhodopirellula europaea]|jgi:putative heme-binding domain-containing protein|uniref:Membrane-bound dehydrogenase domain protein n=1 Tax=Rhodopirellula europaea SH398 TaxID=1263868 RepID=M5RVX6_9BACT|nr:PVC-type heme-binding CxxCH protein [Rhodopirellula europaea]EMI23331.1 membrane-bound dehydrogenase domain protein [Rhodopirellula europaea SH398]MCR9207266.1 c-type cytochrome [bacterium]
MKRRRLNHLRSDTHAEFRSSAVFCCLLLVFSLGGGTAVIGQESNPLENATVKTPVGAAEPVTAAEIYGEGVRSTEHLTPAEEMAGFHLPPDFEVRLFASEPDIAKPLNMAMDSEGSLWVTNSVAYPYPVASNEKGPDSVKVLKDTDGDGDADSIRTFADSLNIPMGVLPYGDGCLCFSIPNIWFLRDTDGDGTCDKREVVLGPFDTTRDTHGMINSMRDGGDGWIYACHGFNNQSRVAGTDGHVVTMHSGNTFRFRPDGSRVELHTRGQVNPFGMTRDEWGYWYSADCHSKPITQLVAGACYPSFGRPHDGLGFLPPMMDHLHGSTAISGIQFFPPNSPVIPLRNCFISGNVMTSRLNWNHREFVGATAKGRALPDFLTSDDPWFRPVDIQVDEQGNIYVADFYNKIIGHYEVPLEHPERDRTSGRIWQIRYTGAAIDGDESTGEEQRLVSELRMASEDNADAMALTRVRELLTHESAHVVRIAAECIGRRGDTTDVAGLLATLSLVDDADVVLRQTIRIAIRDLLQRTPGDDPFWKSVPGAEAVSVMLGLKRNEVVDPILAYLGTATQDDGERTSSQALFSHAVSLAQPDQVDACVELAKQMAGGDTEQAFDWLHLISDAVGSQSTSVPASIRAWALELIESEWNALTADGEASVGWFGSGGRDWGTEQRLTYVAPSLAERDEFAELVSSFPLGETYTGMFASDWFEAPERIQFRFAGHNARPGQANPEQNFVRLRSAKTGEVLRQVMPPRSDVAELVVWDTRDVIGQLVRIEAVDGDSGTAYAWLAIGDFTPKRLGPSGSSRRWARVFDWVERLELSEFERHVKELLVDERYGVLARLNAAGTVANLKGKPGMSTLAQFVSAEIGRVDLAESIVVAIEDERWDTIDLLKQLGPHLSASQQRKLVLNWIASGAELAGLFSVIESGVYAAEVLVDADVQQAMEPKLNEALRERMKELTEGIVVDSGRMEKLSQLLASVRSMDSDAVKGKAVFTKHCQTCHQLRGEGSLVGPQLDGAITRSVERLLEDVVLPDRNIDQAFRTQSLLLDDGRVLVGLVASQDDELIRLTTSDGKTQEVRVDSVEAQQASQRSLMPNNLAELMTERELVDLMAYLKSSPAH